MRTNYYLATFIGAATVVLMAQNSVGQTTQIYQDTKQYVVLIQDTLGVRRGTGFIVNRDENTYYVLTAGHVVRNGQFQIRTNLRTDSPTDLGTNSGEVKPVEIIFPLPGIDLALVTFTSSKSYPIAKLAKNNNTAQVSTSIFILGYPANGAGDPEFPGGTVTSRQLSSTGFSQAIFHNVQTREGMSGSPVLTSNGEVVGVHIGSPSQTGFGEAIPIEKYKESAPLIFSQASRDNLATRRFEQAIAISEQIKRLFGEENSEASVIMAYAYFGLENLDKAREEANKAIRFNSNNAEASLLLGTIDYLQKNYLSAIDNVNRANNIDTRNLGGYALAIRGLSYTEILKSEEANTSASRAIDLLSTDSFIYLARSCVRIRTIADDEGARSDLANARSPDRQRLPENPFLAVLSPVLQQAAMSCLPVTLLPGIITPPPNPLLAGRYKLNEPTQLGEESTGLAVSRDSRFVATGLQDGTVSIYDIQTRNKVASFSSGQGRDDISSIAFSPNSRDIAIAATNGVVRIFNIQNQQEKYSLVDAGSRPLVVFSNNSNFLFIGSGSGTLRMVDNRNGQMIVAESNTHSSGIASLTLSPDGRSLASGGGDGVIKLWSTSDLTPIDSYQAHQGAVISLAFSPDGSQIISIGDSVVKSCNLQNKSCNEIANTRDNLNSLAVANNGHIAFSEVSFLIQRENPIFLRDLRSGQSLGTLSGHRDRIVALAYTPDSRYLISGSSDGTIIIWEVQ